MARILVTDGEQRSCLAVVRSLGRARHDLFVCSASSRPLAGASRYCRGAYTVPAPALDRDAYARALVRILDATGAELLLPLTDASATAVPAVRRSRPRVTVAFPPQQAYEEISDKRRLTQAATALGIPVPREVVLSEAPTDATVVLERLAREHIALPVVVKPSRSVVPRLGGLVSLGVRVIASAGELSEALAAFGEEAYPVLVQERIIGPGLGAFALAEKGRVMAWFAHRRLREKPPSGGVSVYRESVPLREDLRTHAERLLGSFEWSGVAMVEFKEDAASGTPYLMEVNARFWGSLQLAIDAGVDFPKLLVDLTLGRDVPAVTGYRLGIRSRWLWGDVDHLLWMLKAPPRQRKLHPALPTRRRALARFLVPWRPGDRFEVLRLGDPAPFLRESAQWLGRT